MRHLIQIVLTMLLLTTSYQVAAESGSDERAFRTAEIGRHSIKLLSDNTGVVDDFSCLDCGFKQLKIDAKTAAYLGDEKISVKQISSHVKADVGFVKYSDTSNTVYEIHFSY